MSEFGKNLRKYRKAAGLSQVQLGEQAGYSQNAISKMEAGGAERPRKLDRLASILRVSEIELLYGESDGAQVSGDEHSDQPAVSDAIGSYGSAGPTTLNTNDMMLLRDSITKVSDLLFMFEGQEPSSEDVARGAVALFNRASKAGKVISDISPTEITSICEAAFSPRS